MLQFKQDDTEAVMILTLTEFATIHPLYYLFVFTHVETRDVVAFVKSEVDDESNYPKRYNQFTIDASDVFSAKQPGEWHYIVYEQTSDTNIEPSLSGSVLEYGKLLLGRSSEFGYSQYDQPTSYKIYNG